jgi:hypothetical protein
MEENVKYGYVSGIGCLLATGIFIVIIFNQGWNLSSQVLTVFSAIFGILGIGSLIKPESIGQIAHEILKNFSKSDNPRSTKSFHQKSGDKSKNIQGETVNYTETHYHGK